MKEHTIPITITLLILIVGSVYYFNIVVPEQNLIKNSAQIYKDARIKVAFSPEGNMKLFVNTKNSELAKLKISEGSNLPETTSIVVGASEAEMMRKEKLFANIGDPIKGLFGIDTTIGRILKKRGDFTDDVHFVSDVQFATLQADENRIFVKITPEDDVELMYHYTIDTIPKIILSEGNMSDYKIKVIDNKTYVPLILGATDAEMMRKEGEFKNIGDTEEGFGIDFVIIGIANKTNSAMDMMHITPLEAKDIE